MGDNQSGRGKAQKDDDDKNNKDQKDELRALREEFQRELDRYKFYIASNFYEDNIGAVEVVSKPTRGDDGPPEIQQASFQIPSFVQCLTQYTRD